MNRDLLVSAFSPTWLGSVLECHGTLTSTNDRARQLLDEMGPRAHGAVVFADEQTGGRGRLGRAWHSPRGMGLAASIALWPEDAPDGFACLPMAGSLAVLGALLETKGAEVRLKWPNDILMHGLKVGGVLVESRFQGERPAGLVMGIGVNLLHSDGDFPEDLRATATSVRLACGAILAPEVFAGRLLRHLGPLLESGMRSPGSLVQAAHPYWDHRPGDLLEVACPESTFRGQFSGIGPGGALQIEVDGAPRTVQYGEVVRVRRAGE
jgi:BirA family transcriptional regulator, biotin operon repressor / biotin---[acetyl-CoA-carboxylase] ligase